MNHSSSDSSHTTVSPGGVAALFQSVGSKPGVLQSLQEQWYAYREDQRIKRNPDYHRCIVGHPVEWKEKCWAHFFYSRKTLIQLFREDPIYHEAIFVREPCRVFVEFDLKGASREEGNRILTDIVLPQMQDRILNEYHYNGPNSEPVIWDSWRDDKFSVHIIYPDVWVESPLVLPELTRNIHPGIDTQPYPLPGRATPTFLRMPYAMKIHTKGKQMRMPGTELKPRGGPERFNRFSTSWFLRGCVSVGMVDPPTDACYYLKLSVLDVSAVLSRTSFVALDLPVARGIRQVLTYLRRLHGPFNPSGVKIQRAPYEWSLVATPALFCTQRYRTKGGGYHENNGTQITMFQDKYGRLRVYLKCLDKECQDSIEGGIELLPGDFRKMYRKAMDTLSEEEQEKDSKMPESKRVQTV